MMQTKVKFLEADARAHIGQKPNPGFSAMSIG
jgi:hypothetical protein